jgi:shikimate kinase
VSQVLLIGPVCAGKTSVLPFVATGLGTSGVDLDEVAETYYEEVGFGRSRLQEVGAQLGDLGAFRWWQGGHPHAVRRVLEDHRSAVIALGAGHTVFADPALQAEVRELLRPHTVVLLLPSPDLEESVRVVRQRALDARGMSWIMDGHDVIDEWIKGPQNAQLADVTVFARDRSPAKIADEVLARVGVA